MQESAWGEISALAAAAPYPVQVLGADPGRAAACLAELGVTTRSWLGAVVANSGGLVVDHGWLRVLGAGHGGLPDVVAETDAGAARLVTAYDVMGGQFAWFAGAPGAVPSVHYFGPDDLTWQDLDLGYGEWLETMLAGSSTGFYAELRWPGWESEVAGLALDQGLSAWPPPWTEEGKDLAAVSRTPVPLAELVSAYRDAARQLGLP